MKPFHVYKKQSSLDNTFGFAESLKHCLVIFSIVFILVFPFFVYGETALELQNKIKAKDAEIAKLELEIQTYQSELNSLGEQKNSLSRSISELNLTKKKLEADINVTQTKIGKTNFTIQSLGSDIINKEGAISNNIESVKAGLRRTYEFEQGGIIEIILSDNNVTVLWNDIDNIISIREKIRKNTISLRQIKGELEDTREETIIAKNELTALRSKLSDQEKIVRQNTNQKSQLLKQTKNSEVNYQKLLKDRVAKVEAFEKELSDYEAQLKFILDPSSLPSTGVLSWPLDSIFITSLYGPRWGRFHGGIDFRASVGTSVKSMADGVVKGVGDTDECCPGASLGKWIFIEHNNGLSSTFAHLSLIKVKEGQIIKRGEVVGYSGNSGSSTGPHLHVSVYVSSGVKVDSFESKSYPNRILTQPIAATSAYLDPRYYLPL